MSSIGVDFEIDFDSLLDDEDSKDLKHEREEENPPPPPPPPPAPEGLELRIADVKKRLEELKKKSKEDRDQEALAIGAKKKELAQIKAQIMFDTAIHASLKRAGVDLKGDHGGAGKILAAVKKMTDARAAMADALTAFEEGMAELKIAYGGDESSSS